MWHLLIHPYWSHHIARSLHKKSNVTQRQRKRRRDSERLFLKIHCRWNYTIASNLGKITEKNMIFKIRWHLTLLLLHLICELQPSRSSQKQTAPLQPWSNKVKVCIQAGGISIGDKFWTLPWSLGSPAGAHTRSELPSICNIEWCGIEMLKQPPLGRSPSLCFHHVESWHRPSRWELRQDLQTRTFARSPWELTNLSSRRPAYWMISFG